MEYRELAQLILDNDEITSLIRICCLLESLLQVSEIADERFGEAERNFIEDILEFGNDHKYPNF